MKTVLIILVVLFIVAYLKQANYEKYTITLRNR